MQEFNGKFDLYVNVHNESNWIKAIETKCECSQKLHSVLIFLTKFYLEAAYANIEQIC